MLLANIFYVTGNDVNCLNKVNVCRTNHWCMRIQSINDLFVMTFNINDSSANKLLIHTKMYNRMFVRRVTVKYW